MTKDELLNTLHDIGLVPVVKIDDAAKLGEGQNSASKVIDAMTSKK